AICVEWRYVKRRGRVTKLTQHLANEQVGILAARLGYAKLADGLHRQGVERPQIAHQRSIITGLALEAWRGAVGPGALTGTGPFLDRGFLCPFERGPYGFAAVGSYRAQRPAAVQRIGRLLGWSLRPGHPNSNATQHRSSRNG